MPTAQFSFAAPVESEAMADVYAQAIEYMFELVGVDVVVPVEIMED